MIRIFRGTSQATIIDTLGDPAERKVGLRDDGKREEWKYIRRVEFGYALQSMDSGTQRVSSYQRARFIETSRIIFVSGVVDDIKIIRNPESMNPSDPYDRRYP